ncbi:MAG TPA: DUF2092 domain-containing protein [Candidatus Baltobacteraceae bacterium]|nr:DUF2092 domain-containing protein [Candidatus Baltobacteraceae bacterium]
MASVLLAVSSPHIDPRAIALLERMSGTLSRAVSIVVTAHIEREHIDANGQILNSYVTTMAAMRRPNMLYTATVGDGRPYATWYDGSLLTVYIPARKTFDQLFYAGDDDVVLRKISRLRMGYSPMTPFLNSDPYASLRHEIRGARVIADVYAGDVLCRQIAFTGPHMDWQIWITLDDEPLPARMAVVFKRRPGNPRLVVEFQRWDLDLLLDQSTFYFKRPPHARRASFARWN